MEKLNLYLTKYPELVELLDVIGIKTLEDFAHANPRVILPDLHKAKRYFKSAATIPNAAQLQYWIEEASTQPIATPLEEIQIAIADINLASTPKLKKDDDTARREEKCRAAKNNFHAGTFLEPTEKKKSYLTQRGISHMHGTSTYAVSLFLILSYIVGAIMFSYAVWSMLDGKQNWLLWGLLIAFIAIYFIYLGLRKRSRCSVCGIQIFSFGLKEINYNHKAHHIVLLGHNIPTALHVLLFKWFRCPACGTSQRIGSKD